MRSRGVLGVVRVVSTVLAVFAAADGRAQGAPDVPPAPTPPPASAGPSRRLGVRVVPPSPGQSPDLGQALPLNPVEMVRTEPAGATEETPGNELVLAPLPLSNPAIGSGLAVAAVYTIAARAAERASPPTTLGGGGFYTNNGSWAGAAGVKLYLKQDRFRATIGAGLGRINYDLFAEDPDGNGVPIRQDFEAALGEFMVGLGKRWYVGLRASYGTTQVALRDGGDEPLPVPPDQLDVKLGSLGLKGERDSRDSVFYPTSGSRLQLLVNHSDTELGSDYTYTKTNLSYSGYVRLADPLVLAFQVAGCNATSGGPFFDLCLFGTENVLRGYTAGQYLDRWTAATQAEVRWRFANRWVTTAFVGVGGVKPLYSLSDEIEVLPAGGVGVQWIAAPANMITLRADWAAGEGGSRGFYIGIGQAF
jgi:hypothetical protein